MSKTPRDCGLARVYRAKVQDVRKGNTWVSILRSDNRAFSRWPNQTVGQLKIATFERPLFRAECKDYE